MTQDNKAAPAACPFCGNAESILTEHVSGTVAHPAYYERCDNCGAQGPITDKGDHIEKWSQRATALASADNPSTAGAANISVPRVTLLMIYAAMNHMGDILNGMDACEEEDEEATTPAFDAMRELLDDSYLAAPVTQSTAGDAKGGIDLSNQLLEYADNPGYSHNDYADTMRMAADEIDRLTGLLAAPAAQAPTPTAAEVRDQALNGIPATHRHDEGAIARCSYCGRYSLDPATLSDRQPMCDCGKQHGWCGSFKRPTADSTWSGKAPEQSALGEKGGEL